MAYPSLQQVQQVPHQIYARFGWECSREELAGLLGLSSTKSGAFLAKLGMARDLGLITVGRGATGKVRVTDRGLGIPPEPPTPPTQTLHPLAAAMRDMLPPLETDFPAAKQEEWLHAMEHALALIYA